MSAWQLGIDFGTSYTVAAIAQDGNVSVVDIESDGRARIPSAVFLTKDGEILVGTAAQHQAVFAPDRYEPTPKRSLGEGELFLGDRLVPVTDLVAAVLRRVYTEACRQQGERVPSEVRVTHPAEWGDTRIAVFREAIEKAGLPTVSLVAEPVAAAARIALESTQPSQHVAVYDFGGGTFDAAVLLRTDDGFQVAGPPAGRDPLGGEDIDEDIIVYLGEVLAEENPEAWRSLRNPEDVAWRRNAAAFRSEVQRAKETLSEITVCQLWVPGLERDVQLTRVELEKLIGDDVDETVTTLQTAMEDASVTADRLAGIYLVGGSSRIPLVADTIWRRLGVRPSVQDNPKSVVAMGAAAWLTPSHRGPSPRPSEPAAPAGLAATRRPAVESPSGGQDAMVSFRTPIAMSLEGATWSGGFDCTAYLVIDHVGAPPVTFRARDEPATAGDSQQLAAQVLAQRAPRTPGFRELWVGPAPVLGRSGFERRFAMNTRAGPLTMFEQYLVTDGRSLVLACPESARAVAQSIVLAGPQLPGASWFEPRFELSHPPDWSVAEQVVLQQRGSTHGVTANCVTFAPGMDPGGWREQQLGYLMGLAGAQTVSRTSGRVFGELDGEIVTVQWSDRGIYMLTKLGLVIVPGWGLSVAISLPHAEQGLFQALARHARLHPVGAGLLREHRT